MRLAQGLREGLTAGETIGGVDLDGSLDDRVQGGHPQMDDLVPFVLAPAADGRRVLLLKGKPATHQAVKHHTDSRNIRPAIEDGAAAKTCSGAM